jgi:hypothetical protein
VLSMSEARGSIPAKREKTVSLGSPLGLPVLKEVAFQSPGHPLEAAWSDGAGVQTSRRSREMGGGAASQCGSSVGGDRVLVDQVRGL